MILVETVHPVYSIIRQQNGCTKKKKNIGTTKIITVITVLKLEQFDFTVW